MRLFEIQSDTDKQDVLISETDIMLYPLSRIIAAAGMFYCIIRLAHYTWNMKYRQVSNIRRTLVGN